MIYASGVVTFLANPKEVNKFKKFKRKTITLEIIENDFPSDNNNPIRRISCRFTAFLPSSFECKSLEDYTGKIKPHLQKSIKHTIVSVHVSHLNYLSEQAMDRIKKNR